MTRAADPAPGTVALADVAGTGIDRAFSGKPTRPVLVVAQDEPDRVIVYPCSTNRQRRDSICLGDLFGRGQTWVAYSHGLFDLLLSRLYREPRAAWDEWPSWLRANEAAVAVHLAELRARRAAPEAPQHASALGAALPADVAARLRSRAEAHEAERKRREAPPPPKPTPPAPVKDEFEAALEEGGFSPRDKYGG